MDMEATSHDDLFDAFRLSLQFWHWKGGIFTIVVSKEHKHMLAHAKVLMEYRNGYVAIHPRYNKLITALRTAVENSEGMLDKEATSFDDLFDSFRLSLMFWH